MMRRLLFAFLIVAVSVTAAVVVLSVRRGAQRPPGDGVAPRLTPAPRDVAAICADIWSRKRQPRLSYEMWCADNAPPGTMPPPNIVAGDR